MDSRKKYQVVLLSMKWRLPVEFYYFPYSADGLRRATEKQSELMARYLGNKVELNVIEDERAG